MNVLAERETSYHLARLLLLLAPFSHRGKSLEGLTKLAKLDFLLRYPVFFERLLETDGRSWPRGLEPTDSERSAVESAMIRYKYGPWDDRYYSLIGGLISRGLAEQTGSRSKVVLRLTPEGSEAAEMLAADPAWAQVADRAAFLVKHYDVSGARLKNRIYKELPEVVDRPYWSEIP